MNPCSISFACQTYEDNVDGSGQRTRRSIQIQVEVAKGDQVERGPDDDLEATEFKCKRMIANGLSLAISPPGHEFQRTSGQDWHIGATISRFQSRSPRTRIPAPLPVGGDVSQVPDSLSYITSLLLCIETLSMVSCCAPPPPYFSLRIVIPLFAKICWCVARWWKYAPYLSSTSSIL
ncbi:hypothetical protein BDQ17DRAFT_313641 [Cyathus striatus]|nr:hypothetical protein BDQ17DRAFT_313641 [Cyathus striatus]